MENEKGFIHADIEDKEDSVDVAVTVNNLDIFMAAAGLKDNLNALSERDKYAALLAWANASQDAFGYKVAAAALVACEETDLQAEEKKEEGESEEE